MSTQELEQARQTLRAGQAAAARELLKAIVAAKPTHADALRLLSIAHLELGERREAAAAAQSAVVAAPGQPDALYQLGQAMFATGQRDRAQEAYEQAVAAAPTMSPAWTNLGRLHDDAFRHEEAVRCYDRALQLAPGDATALANRGNALLALERFVEASAAYDDALKSDPRAWPALLGKQTALIELGHLDSARAVPVAGTPADRGELHEHRAPWAGGAVVVRWQSGRHPQPGFLAHEAEALAQRVVGALEAGAPVDQPIGVGLAPISLRAEASDLLVCLPDLHRDPMRHRTALASFYLQAVVMAGMLGARVRAAPATVSWYQTVEIAPDALDVQRLRMHRVPPVDGQDSGWRVVAEPPTNQPPARLPIVLLLKIRPGITRAFTLPTAWSVAYDGDVLRSARDASGAERLASTGP